MKHRIERETSKIDILDYRRFPRTTQKFFALLHVNFAVAEMTRDSMSTFDSSAKAEVRKILLHFPAVNKCHNVLINYSKQNFLVIENC